MTIKFLGKSLKNPMVLASGVLGNSHDILERVHKKGCGLVTMKSIGPEPRDGHKNPTVIDLGCGMINAVGLPTPGYLNMENEWDDLEKRAGRCRESNCIGMNSWGSWPWMAACERCLAPLRPRVQRANRDASWSCRLPAHHWPRWPPTAG